MAITGDLTLIDRLWVEQRLYDIEEETDLPQPISKLAEMGGKILSSHDSDEKTAGIVILGESTYCLPIMRSRPFPSTARMPKETEIFQMKKLFHNGIIILGSANFWAHIHQNLVPPHLPACQTPQEPFLGRLCSTTHLPKSLIFQRSLRQHNSAHL